MQTTTKIIEAMSRRNAPFADFIARKKLITPYAVSELSMIGLQTWYCNRKADQLAKKHPRLAIAAKVAIVVCTTASILTTAAVVRQANELAKTN